jgi:DNA-binding XRE family transcriptional regulator
MPEAKEELKPESQRFSDMAAWREVMGLNTYEAAEKLGISRTTLWQIERDRKAPSLTVQLAMEALSARGEASVIARRVERMEAQLARMERWFATQKALDAARTEGPAPQAEGGEGKKASCADTCADGSLPVLNPGALPNDGRCPKCGGEHPGRYEGACLGPPLPSAPPPHRRQG